MTVKTLRPLVLAATAVVAASCGSPDSASLPIVRDSADVRIAENPAGMSGDDWELRLPPQLVIGRAEGTDDVPDLFGGISHAIRLSSGDVAVADGMAGEIRVFDGDGEHLRTFGGRGQGPGEFSTLWRIAELPGDTIVAADPLGGRISYFASSGAFVRSFPIPPLPGASGPAVVGWLDDGALVVNALVLPVSGDARDRSTRSLYPVDRNGEALSALGEFLDQRLGSNGLGLAFGAQAHFAAGGDLVWYGHSSRFELVGRDLTGSVRRIVRRDRVPRAVTEAEIEEARAAAEKSLRGIPGTAADRIRATEFASSYPVHGRFLVDELGNLWVERYRGDLIVDSGSPEWDIFDSEGRLTGALTTPGDFRVTDVDAGSVLGVHVNSLGVGTVRMYRLDR